MATKYKLLLPKTKFPLRVNPILHDPAVQKAAQYDSLYKWQQEEFAESTKVFTLHDGPPYANGEPHMGHVLNKVLKDIVNRYKLLRGYRINYRPGWDCHGLPIELKACKETDLLKSTPLKIRSKASQFAQKAIKLQMESFKQWGCLGDWDNPYLTMDPAYEAEQISVFYKMYKRGCIYRGFKPVYWSPSSHSALAEAELEYRDHTSQAIYVLFPLTNFLTTQLSQDERTAGRDLHALVWTTTPWTLVANRAICFNPTHQYSLVEVRGGDQLEKKLVLIGTQCISKLNNMVETFEIISTFEGSELNGFEYHNPLLSSSEEDTLPFLEGSHVTETEGTGLVHTAPAHGFEDYHIGIQHGLNLECNVDDQGKYTSEVGSDLQGLFVLKEGNEAVISQLENLGILVHRGPYSHRYPYDWRTKKPVLIRSTEQWFASVNELKEEAKTALKDVQMYPPSSINRLSSMLESREDWCISRQRVWGVPIPVFYHKHSGEPLLNDETISHIQELVCGHGSNCWWKLPIEELLPSSLKSAAADYTRGTDTMDVWFDSGSSWATVLKESDHVADMYLEGSDQHRGWFQSSLLTSVAAQGKAPYKAIVTHGFVLDERGTKMSKSIGNVTSPRDILHSKKLGADVMRMWVAFSDYSSEVHLGDGILQQTNDFLLKIRNTCRFIIGNLAQFDPSSDNLLPYSELSKLDHYILHVMNNYLQEATQAYDSLNFSKLHSLLRHLVPRDLSTFYLDIIKDRLYCDFSTSIGRRSTQTTLHHILQSFVTSLAPVAPHIAEEVVQYYPFEKGSVFKTGWVDNPDWFQPELAKEFETIRSVRDICNKTLDRARSDKTIKSSLEADATISTSSAKLSSLLKQHNTTASASNSVEFPLSDILLVSATSITEKEPSVASCYVVKDWVECGEEDMVEVGVSVWPSKKSKCPRCWKHTSSNEDALCERCSVVENMQ